MQEFRLPDGSIATLDPANPEHAAWARAAKAEPMKSSVGGLVKQGLSGLAEGAAKLPFLGSDLLNLGLDATQKHLNPKWMQGEGYRDFREAHKGSGHVDALLEGLGTGFRKPENQAERMVDAIGQGTGGGLASLGPRLAAPTARVLPLKPVLQPPELVRSTAARAAVPAAVAGGAAGAAGQGTTEATDNPLLGLAAGVVTGGLAGGIMSRTPQSKAALALAGQAHTPQDFAAAGKNVDLFQKTGAKSATLGEAFGDRSPFIDIVQEAGEQAGGNSIIGKLAARDGDKQQLIARALNSLGPAPDAQRVANQASAAAKTRLDQMDGAASDVYRRRIAQTPPLPEAEVQSLSDMFKNMAGQTQSATEKQAFTAFAETLMQPPKPVQMRVGGKIVTRMQVDPKTDVQAIMTDAKQLRDAPTIDPVTRAPGAKLEARAYNTAYRMLMDGLKQLDPTASPVKGLAGAEAGYAKVKRMVANPARESPLKTLAGSENDVSRPAAVSRLNSLVQDQDPAGTQRLMQSLSKGSDSPDELKQQIARVLLERRVTSGTGNVAEKLVGGTPGSRAAEQTDALLKSAGANSAAFQEPVEAARLLSRVPDTRGGAVQRGKGLSTNWLTTLVNPWYDVTLRGSLAARKKGYEEIADLLGKPTKANLAKLEELMKSDPNLRLKLGLGGGLAAGTQQGEQ